MASNVFRLGAIIIKLFLIKVFNCFQYFILLEDDLFCMNVKVSGQTTGLCFFDGQNPLNILVKSLRVRTENLISCLKECLEIEFPYSQKYCFYIVPRMVFLN